MPKPGYSPDSWDERLLSDGILDDQCLDDRALDYSGDVTTQECTVPQYDNVNVSLIRSEISRVARELDEQTISTEGAATRLYEHSQTLPIHEPGNLKVYAEQIGYLLPPQVMEKFLAKHEAFRLRALSQQQAYLRRIEQTGRNPVTGHLGPGLIIQPGALALGKATGLDQILPYFDPAIHAMESFEAFFEGLIDGLIEVRNDLTPQEIKALFVNVMQHELVGAVFLPVKGNLFVAGTLYGLGERMVDDIKGIFELIWNYEAMWDMLTRLFTSAGDELAYLMGKEMAKQKADELIAHMRDGSFVSYVFNSGRMFGPIMVDLILFIVGLFVSGGALSVIAGSSRAMSYAEKVFSPIIKGGRRLLLAQKMSEAFYERMLPVIRHFPDGERILVRFADEVPNSRFLDNLADLADESPEDAARILEEIQDLSGDQMRGIEIMDNYIEGGDGDVMDFITINADMGTRSVRDDAFKIIHDLHEQMADNTSLGRIVDHLTRPHNNDWQGALGQLYTTHKLFNNPRFEGAIFRFEVKEILDESGDIVRRLDVEMTTETRKYLVEVKGNLSDFSITRQIREEIAKDLIMGIDDNFDNLMWFIPDNFRGKTSRLIDEFRTQMRHSDVVDALSERGLTPEQGLEMLQDRLTRSPSLVNTFSFELN